MELAIKLNENTTLTLSDHVTRVYASMLLLVYSVFLCSYFIFDEYGDPYRFFARVLFVLGIFVFDRGIRNTWKHPLFFAITGYMTYLLLSGFWSDPLDWYRLGQKFTISLYLFSFIAITQFLVNWNPRWFERMLQICTLFASVAAAISIVVFYSEKPFPTTRLVAIGSLTNINEFANIYGVFAILAMFFAMRSQGRPLKSIFLLAVVVLICVAWFGQSRTAFTSSAIALLALVGLTLQQRSLLYLAILATLGAILFFFFPDVLEQAYLRGQGLRPLIWAQIWDEAKSTPIFGHGFISQISVKAGKHTMETSHNAFLQVFWQGGVVGLLIFLLLLGTAFRYAWSRGLQQGDYRVFCILLFAICAMMTGVDSLIERPRDQWMLFWFPLALLLSYPSGVPVSQLRSARAISKQPSDRTDAK